MSLPYLQATSTLVTLNQNLQLGSNVTMLDNAGRVMWVPGSTVQWQPTPAPPVLAPPGGFTFAAGAATAATYRWIGNEIVVNVNVVGTVEAVGTDRTGDYTLSVPYPVAAATAPAIVGDLWLSVTTAGNTFSFKAYARTIVGNANALTVRFLSGSTDDTLASVDAGSALTLQGTVVYATTMINNGTQLTQPYSLPVAFRQNQGGQVILDGSGIGIQPRGQFDVATYSNVPALVVDQRSGGGVDVMDLMIGGVKSVVVSGTGYVGIGTTVPTAKLDVVGNARIQGDLTVNGTQTIINTNVGTTEQLVITNDGTGPALVVNQTGAQPVLDFQDDGVSALRIADGGNVGIGTTVPLAKLDVNGDIIASRIFSPGMIVQVQSVSYSGNATIGPGLTYVDIDASLFYVTITPKFSNSKMLIQGMLHYGGNAATDSRWVFFRLARVISGVTSEIGNGTTTGTGNIGTPCIAAHNWGAYSGYDTQVANVSILYMDSPATSLPITYKFRWTISTTDTTTARIAYMNRTHTHNDSARANTISTMTVTEIAQ